MSFVKYFFIAYIFLTCLVWAYVIPFNEGPDEFSHYDVAAFMARNHHFPVFGVDKNMGVSVYEIPGVVLKQNASYASMPPLAYIWQAIWLKLIPWPDSTDYLVARVANSLLIIGYGLLIWNISKKLFTETTLRWVFRMVMIATPQILFTFSYVNSDALLLFFSAILWWWIVRLWQLHHPMSTSEYIGLGLSLGAAALTRYNIAPVLLVTVALLGWKTWERRTSQGWFNLGLTGLVGIAVAGWWYLRNQLLYGEFLASGQFWQTYYMLYPRNLVPGFWEVALNRSWWWESWISLWGSFGWHTLLVPQWIYRVLLGGLLLGCLGMASRLAKSRHPHHLRLLLLFVSLVDLSILLSLYQSWHFANQPQGRYLYSGWIGVGILMVMSLKLVHPSWRTYGGVVSISCMVGWVVYSLLGVVLLHYY